MRHVKVNAKHIKTPVGLLLEAKGKKIYRSEEVNFNFDMKTGHMMTWGKTPADDPIYSHFPFILDIEITTKCNGPCW